MPTVERDSANVRVLPSATALPRRQARVLARIRRVGWAYLDRSELGATWRTPDGARIDGGLIRRLSDRGLLAAAGDALLPDDTQTLIPLPPVPGEVR